MTDSTLLSLARADTDAIEGLWRSLQVLPAKSRVLEEHVESDALRGALAPLLGQPAWLVSSLLEAILAERGSFESAESETSSQETAASTAAPRLEYRATRSRGLTSPELVWSGATAPRSCARSTREAIEDLFAGVENDVFIAGYSFDHASDLFMPVFARTIALAAAGHKPPRVRVVLDCSREPARSDDTPERIAERVRAKFLETCWKDAPIVPELRYHAESAERTDDGFARFSMHAKCIIVDNDRALVGSANFSNRGRDRNLEVGALIRDYHFVQSLSAEWEALWPLLSAC